VNADEGLLAALARAAAIEIPTADIDPLRLALENHLEAVEALAAVPVEDIDPIVTFDPRWT